MKSESPDPYTMHPSIKLEKKKYNNVLTLRQVNAIIDKEIEEVLSWTSDPYGFTREDFVEVLEQMKENVKKKCLDN